MNLGSFASRVVATKVVALDGTGDFTDIQSAIDDLPSGGGVVYVKEGTYTITSSINVNKPNVALFGAGRATKIETTDNIVMVDVTEDNSYITDIYLYGAGAGIDNVGVRLLNSDDAHIRNLWIENCGNDGIRGGVQCHRTFIHNCNIKSCVSHGIELIGFFGEVKENIITNNYLANNSENGISIYVASRTICEGNISVNNSIGILIDVNCSDTLVLGNIFLGNTGEQISDSASDTELAHNITA